MLRARDWMRGLLVLGFVGAGAVVQARADEKPVALQVWTIRATMKNKDISPELKSLAEKLKNQFKYTGYKLEKRGTGSAAIDKEFKTGLIAGFEARITPKRRDGERVQLQVEVFKAIKDKKVRMLSATVTIPAGQFQLFGGWDIEDSDKLIMAVSGK